MDSHYMLGDGHSFLEMWDSIPGHQSHCEQSIFDMLDEDIEIVLKSESHSGLINEDLMWNSTATFGSLELGTDFDSLGSDFDSLGSDFDSSILAGNIADSPLFDDAGSPFIDDAGSPFIDDAGFDSDIDVDNLIESLEKNNYNGVNTTPATAQSFLAEPYTATQAIVHPQTYKTPASASLMPLHGSQLASRANVRKLSATTARVVSASRGESIIMRPLSGASIQKSKSTARNAVSMLTTTPRQAMPAARAPQLLKFSPKGRQATMLKASGTAGMTNLSLLSTQDAMLKGASAMISPPASSDSDESIVFGEDCSREKTKTKKRISATGVCMPASRVASSTNILASIQPNSATVFSQVTAVTGLSTIGHLTPAASPASSQSSGTPASQTKPIKRREHNDSERKRRDHLRTAFDELKQKVPKLANSERKPARIMILSEAANYAREITDADERNQIALQEAMAERHRLQQLIEHYRSHGLE